MRNASGNCLNPSNCAAANYKRVITFTGMKADGIEDEQAEKKLHFLLEKSFLSPRRRTRLPFASEHLNIRDDSHPMKDIPDTLATASTIV